MSYYKKSEQPILGVIVSRLPTMRVEIITPEEQLAKLVGALSTGTIPPYDYTPSSWVYQLREATYGQVVDGSNETNANQALINLLNKEINRSSSGRFCLAPSDNGPHQTLEAALLEAVLIDASRGGAMRLWFGRGNVVTDTGCFDPWTAA